MFLTACANIVTPSGGEKDTIPPTVVEEIPSNNSVFFNANQIRISFNEYVLLRDPLRQIIISPPLFPAPEYTIRQRTLIITLPDTLNQKTTYTINFGNAIVDNTEGNVLSDYQYIFSTGSFIDSLFITGNVTNAFNNEPVKDALVMLYNTFDDSLPYNTRPSYFARTNDGGNYRIANIGAGDYKIFVLKDENNNYLFDQPAELIGFKDQVINPADTSVINLSAFINEPEQQRLINTFSEYPGRVVMIFNNPMGEVRFGSLTQDAAPEIIYQEFTTNRDTLFIWAADTTRDTMQFILFNNDVQLDTVIVPTRRGRYNANKLNVVIPGFLGQIPPGDSITLEFNNPLTRVDTASVILLEDSVHRVPVSLSYLDTLTRRMNIRFNSEENKSFNLIILPGAFTDIYNNVNDTIKQQIRVRPVRDFGSLAITFNPVDSADYIIQLVDFKERIVRETKWNREIITFDLISPGDYRIKVVVDFNSNGRWDTGNYLRKRQPEKVFYFTENITIRANWFVEQTWNLPSWQND